jgi:hypothetical protein
MRTRLLAAALVLAAASAGVATASVRPVRPADEALLRRPPTKEERVAEQVAARLTQRQPEIRCGALGVPGAGWPDGIAGITLFVARGKPAGYAILLPQVCAQLYAFRLNPSAWDPSACTSQDNCVKVAEAAFAIETVTHESYHLLGYENEARVECYGMQSIWYAAMKLGATAAEGQRLARFYATALYPDRQYSTPAYWSPECRDGGKYDLRPSSHSWPS